MRDRQDHRHSPFEAVVLVADPLEDSAPDSRTFLRRDLEKTSNRVLDEVVGSISRLGFDCTIYKEPSQLASAADRHKNDIVLSIYGGEKSRNRMALVPAICESFGLNYIGPDAYGRVLCQDKEMSKRLAKEAGLQTPAHLMLRDDSSLELLCRFPLPYVIKPVWEGSSIGIGPKNLVHTASDGILLAKQLLDTMRQPLLAERFIPGLEVNYSLIQLKDRTESRITQMVLEGCPNYFDENLFNAEDKLSEFSRFKNIMLSPDSMRADDLAALERLPSIVGGVGYARIDGKLFAGQFHFLEITPDAWLSASGAFASGFLQDGWTYDAVIEAILLSNRS